MISVGFLMRDEIAQHLDGYNNYRVTLKYMYRLADKYQINLFMLGPDSFRGNRLWGNQLKNGKWQQSEFDYPQMVYTRVPFVSKFYKIQAKIEKNTKLINELKIKKFLRNKFKTSKFLTKLGFSQPKIVYFQEENLIKFLYNHQSVYLKPVGGSWGSYQLKVSLTKDKYLVQFSYKNRKFYFDSKKNLISKINKYIKKINCRYIIQEEIKVIPYDNRVFDIRVLIQKNGQNIWKISGMGARVGKKEGVTSNIKSGGSFVRTSKVLKKIFGEKKKKKIIKKIKIICKDIAKKLDQDIGRCGELGFDILVDKFGKIWVLEINSQPGYVIFNRMGINPKKSQRFTTILCQRVLEYGKYLATVSE